MRSRRWQCNAEPLIGLPQFRNSVGQAYRERVPGAPVSAGDDCLDKDDLLERVLSEPKRDVGFYLDSGWPNDNYEVTIAMALALITRGWRYGHVLYLCFPQAAHDEKAWGMRLHLPMQLFAGMVARASRSAERVSKGSVV